MEILITKANRDIKDIHGCITRDHCLWTGLEVAPCTNKSPKPSHTQLPSSYRWQLTPLVSFSLPS
jgi:hypothetical protein